MSRKHFPMSPSITERVLACPASVKASAGIPDQESAAAAEGTAGHAVGEALLKGEPVTVDVTPEMREAVQVYVDFVAALRREHEVLIEDVERTMECLTLEALGGTSDVHLIFREGSKIVCHVVDFKSGFSPVDSYENKQGLSYCVIIESHYPGMIDEFRFTIVQPRAFSGGEPSTWTCSLDRVMDHKRAIEAAWVEVQAGTRFQAGGHCKYCKVLTTCKEAERQALEVAQTEFSEIKDDAQRLVDLLEKAKAVELLLKAIPDRLVDLYREGQRVEGYKCVETISNSQWLYGDDAMTLKVLKKLGIGKRVAMREVLKTPTQLKKDLDTDEQRQEVDKIIARVPTGYKVVPNSAKGIPHNFAVTEFPIIEETQSQ